MVRHSAMRDLIHSQLCIVWCHSESEYLFLLEATTQLCHKTWLGIVRLWLRLVVGLLIMRCWWCLNDRNIRGSPSVAQSKITYGIRGYILWLKSRLLDWRWLNVHRAYEG
jgi:hypothetical protein